MSEARAQLESVMYDDGAACPCCTQWVKVYRRKITAGMARVLIAMYRASGTDWCDVPALAMSMPGPKRSTGGDEAKARYWGLIEPMPDARRSDGSTRTGWWRLTAAGESYVNGTLAVQKYALIFDGRCLDLDGPTETIEAAVSTQFNYADLMAGR